jgi:hypothetical protein
MLDSDISALAAPLRLALALDEDDNSLWLVLVDY